MKSGSASTIAAPTESCRKTRSAPLPGASTENRWAGGTTDNLGLFVEDDWQIGPLLINGGLRADRTSISDGFYRAVTPAGALVSEVIAPDRSDWALSWRAGALIYATRRLDLRAAAYTGLRLPTLNELYRPFVVFPVVTAANADLRNERLEGFELGLNWQPVNAGGAVAYRLRQTRLKTPSPMSPSPPTCASGRTCRRSRRGGGRGHARRALRHGKP